MRIFIALKIIAYLIIFLLRYKLKVWLPKNLNLKSLSMANQSWLIESLLLYSILMSLLNLFTKKKRKLLKKKQNFLI